MPEFNATEIAIRAIKAEAWDEGWSAAVDAVPADTWFPGWDWDKAPNPYRAEQGESNG